MDLFKERISDFTDEEIVEVINLLHDERRKRQRDADRKLIENFKKAADALAAANICYYISYHNDDIYLGGADDYNFSLLR